MGTPENPITKNVNITLYGKKLDKQFMHFGNKVISVRNSHIDIHGQPRDHTWTHVAATINPGDTSFTTTVSVDWQVGETVVIASTSYEMDEAEQMVIKTRNSGTSFEVTTPFKFKHYSAVETYGSKQFPMYCEVALLTRNVKFFGSDSDSIGTNYGAHMMMMGSEVSGTRGRFSYMELYQVG